MTTKQYKPFNLATAQAGEPIQTRSGEPRKFIAYVPEALPGDQIIVLDPVNRRYCYHFLDGKYQWIGIDSPLDLMMAPTKLKIWVKLYKNKTNNCLTTNYAFQSGHLGLDVEELLLDHEVEF